ncbi:MAG: hypothetical protein H7203_11735 [Rhizobacter sp.]|nr:hypothetical protein [Burkholderiales bacterium]
MAPAGAALTTWLSGADALAGSIESPEYAAVSVVDWLITDGLRVDVKLTIRAKDPITLEEGDSRNEFVSLPI